MFWFFKNLKCNAHKRKILNNFEFFYAVFSSFFLQWSHRLFFKFLPFVFFFFSTHPSDNPRSFKNLKRLLYFFKQILYYICANPTFLLIHWLKAPRSTSLNAETHIILLKFQFLYAWSPSKFINNILEHPI